MSLTGAWPDGFADSVGWQGWDASATKTPSTVASIALRRAQWLY
jgi:hypothetical protein